MTINFVRRIHYLSHLIILALVAYLFSAAGSSATLAQEKAAYIRQVRMMEADATGLEHPSGVAFSSQSNAFLVVPAHAPGQPTPANTRVARLSTWALPLG